MKIKDLPPFIQSIALKRQKEQGNNHNLEVELIDLKHSGSFNWFNTPEGRSIWSDVYKGNFTPFYEFHNKYAKELKWNQILRQELMEEQMKQQKSIPPIESEIERYIQEQEEQQKRMKYESEHIGIKITPKVMLEIQKNMRDCIFGTETLKPYYLTKTIKIKESERTITLCADVSGKELNVGYAVMNPKDKKIDKKLAKEIALGRTKKGSLVSMDISDDLKQNYIFKSILENVFRELERGILIIKGVR